MTLSLCRDKCGLYAPTPQGYAKTRAYCGGYNEKIKNDAKCDHCKRMIPKSDYVDFKVQYRKNRMKVEEPK